MALLVIFINSCITIDTGAQKFTIDQIEKNFDNIVTIDVKGSFCKVKVNSHASANINFTGEIKSNKERDDLKIKYEINGNTLEVWIDKPRSLSGSLGGYLNFLVPLNTNINIKNSSGSIDVKNIGQSTVTLVASSGSIMASNINSSIKATTSSGSIKANNITGSINAISSSGSHMLENIGENVNSSLSSGNIKISQVKGYVKSNSSSGSQYINGVEAGLESSATSGSIKIENVNGDVYSQTSSGSIKLNNIRGILSLISSSGSQYGTGITLTGDSSFKSSSGSINMKLTNTPEELSFKLQASSGGLNAKGSSDKKKLNIERGSIHINGISSSGSQSYQ